MTIDEQKRVADLVLESIEVIDRNAILAGGAPRDWWAELPARDLDFYLYCTPGNGVEHTKRSIEKLLGIELDVLGDESYEGGMDHLGMVLDGEFSGCKVQFMLMNKPTFESVIPFFGASTSMIWYKGGVVRPTYMFLAALEEKTLYIKNGSKAAFIEKTVSKFPKLNVKYVDNIVREAGRALRVAPKASDPVVLKKLLKYFKGNV